MAIQSPSTSLWHTAGVILHRIPATRQQQVNVMSGWRVSRERSEIEVALDEGRIVADGLARPTAELELEPKQKRGSRADLFALAHGLDCVKALNSGVLTNSERGYALADGDEPSSFKAGPIGLKPGMPAAVAFRTIALACIRHFRLNEPLLITSRSAEPLHQARVAMRRLRAALSLFSAMVTDHECERLKRRLRDVSHQLGEARNLDVYIAHTTTLNAGENGGLPPFALDPAGRLQAGRDCAYERVVNTLQSKRFRQLMQDLVAWIEAGPWCTRGEPDRQGARDQNIEDFAAGVLNRRQRKLAQRGRHLDRLSPEERHRIRIEVKKLRYASEFFSGLLVDRKHRKRHTSFIAALEDLQACLGDLNDIQTGSEIAVELARPEAAPSGGSDAQRTMAAYLDEQDKRTAALLTSAREAHQRLSGAKPFWKS